jgi:hypothetical protein
MHAAKARAMKAGAGGFDIDDFVSKLITFMGGRRGGGGPKDRGERQADADYDEDVDDEEDDDEGDEPLNWERIGRKALAKSRRIPVMDFMCVTHHQPPPPPPFRLFFSWHVFTPSVLCLCFLCVRGFSDALGGFSFVEARDRLGPLAVEQKKRAVGRRARFEKNKQDERKPQELREDDIARSENETTKNVIDVSSSRFLPLSFLLTQHPNPCACACACVYRFETCSWSRTAP